MGIEAESEQQDRIQEKEKHEDNNSMNDVIDFYYKMKQFLLEQTNNANNEYVADVNLHVNTINKNNKGLKSEPILIPKPNHLR